jgi:hypothetical protein
MNSVFLILLSLLQTPQPATLARHYLPGESIAYQMRGVNQGHQRTVRYLARADGLVKKDASGNFFEEFAWSNLQVNGEPFVLSPPSQQFRESLSLAPGYTLAVPDLSKVQPILIGPITDLLAFYADVQLAMNQKNLTHAGDHVLLKHGAPNSWADGTYVIFGQDSIDFDITLESTDQTTQTANVVVRHIPPAEMQIKFPASWMLSPVSTSPNNWIEVEKNSAGKFAAQIGMETFLANIKLSLATGRILSATMDNPVEVLQRDCDDAALTVCGSPLRYSIKREISLEAIPTGK